MPFVLGVKSVGYTQSKRRFPAKIDGLTGGGVTAHSALTGLVAPADDHTQYVLASGARAITGQQTIARLLVNTALDDVGRIQLRSNSGAAVDNDESFSLVNKTDATLNNQKWSPALRLVGQGWSTVLGASQECDWRIYNQPVQSTSPIKTELIIDRSIGGGAYLTKFTIDQNGNVVCGYTGFLGVGATPFLGKLHVDQSNPTGQVAVVGLDQGDDDETFIDYVGTSSATGNSIVAFDVDADALKVEVNTNGGSWMNAYASEEIGSGGFARYAQIYSENVGATLTITTGGTYEQFTGFATNGSSNDCTPNQANNKITATKPGLYLVFFQCSFSGTISAEVSFQIRLDGANQPQCHFIRKLGTGGDIGSGSLMGIIDVDSASEDITVWWTSDDDGDQIVAQDVQLTCAWLGST